MQMGHLTVFLKIKGERMENGGRLTQACIQSCQSIDHSVGLVLLVLEFLLNIL
jgi:hypothetical protein